MQKIQKNICSFCGEELIENELEYFYYCPNPDCFSSVILRTQNNEEIADLTYDIERNRSMLVDCHTQKDKFELSIFYLKILGLIDLHLLIQFIKVIPENKGDWWFILRNSLFFLITASILIIIAIKKSQLVSVSDSKIYEINKNINIHEYELNRKIKQTKIL